MPTPSLRFGPGRLEPLEARLQVGHADRPGAVFAVLDAGQDRVVVDGRPARWVEVERSLDADELEIRYQVHDAIAPGLQLLVRHAVGMIWTQRYVLSNGADRSYALDELAVGLAPGAGCLGWSLSAGAEAFWLSEPADGDGPVLAATLQFGDVTDCTAGRWRTGPLRLDPGSRYVVAWQADWYVDAASFERRRPSVLPHSTVLDLGAPAEIVGPDTAVVASDDLGVSREAEVALVLPDRPGRHQVELRSASGTVRTDFVWVQTLPEVVASSAAGLLEAERSGAGIVRLADAAAGLVVQRAITDRLLDQPDPAIDAVEWLAARLLEQEAPEPFALAFLAGEALRTADPDCADRARTGLLAQTRPSPGVGLAATRVGLVEMAAGRPMTNLTSTLARLRASAERLTRSPGPPDLRTVATAVELTLLAGGAEDMAELRRLTRGVGVRLGFGLPGSAMQPAPVADRAHAVAVLGLLPETGLEPDRAWLEAPQAVAEQVRRHCLADLGEPGTARSAEGERATTLAWLVLGQPLG